MAKSKSFLICVFLHFSFACFSQQGFNAPTIREKIQSTYVSQAGVRERTGKNDGIQVEAYLKYVWLKKGDPWCAAFVSWCYSQNGYSKPRSGGCVQLMEQGQTIYLKGKLKEIPQTSDVFFIWFENKGRVAHTGLVDKWSNTWVTTFEGNTNASGSREGDGVYKKYRMKGQIYAVVKYIK